LVSIIYLYESLNFPVLGKWGIIKCSVIYLFSLFYYKLVISWRDVTQPLPPESPTTSSHLRPLQPRKGEREREPYLCCTSRHRRVTLSSLSLPPSLPPPSSVVATTLIRPLSRRGSRGATPPFRARLSRAPPSQFFRQLSHYGSSKVSF